LNGVGQQQKDEINPLRDNPMQSLHVCEVGTDALKSNEWNNLGIVGQSWVCVPSLSFPRVPSTNSSARCPLTPDRIKDSLKWQHLLATLVGEKSLAKRIKSGNQSLLCVTCRVSAL
jgi:hypothetical protein